jgi:hypothetical protein
VPPVETPLRPYLVTADHARTLLGVIEANKATKEFLTTTSDFAQELHKDRLLWPLIGARLELVNKTTLLAWFEQLWRRAEGPSIPKCNIQSSAAWDSILE